eukprot:TRINITY_DN4115_c0_g2_i1.p1 TRINITY_DN4115_c0_g2~~TRINITY_DN4115_c0_g2_i1.p1  ORF type:complete len:593 (+),score=191.59 TRINITY_DN4115_c0_g2_i1:2828-4606(+)
MPANVDNHLGHLVARGLGHRLGRVLLVGDHGEVGPQLAGRLQAGRVALQAHHHDGVGPAGPGHHGGGQTLLARPHDGHALAPLEPADAAEPAHRVAQHRRDKNRLLGAGVLADLVHHGPGREVEELGVGAVEMGRLAAADHGAVILEVIAKGVAAGPAGVALAAAKGVLHDDPLAQLQAAPGQELIAGRLDAPHDLMAQDDGVRPGRPRGLSLEDAGVGAAHSHQLHAQKGVVRPQLGQGKALHLEVAGSGDHHGFAVGHGRASRQKKSSPVYHRPGQGKSSLSCARPAGLTGSIHRSILHLQCNFTYRIAILKREMGRAVAETQRMFVKSLAKGMRLLEAFSPARPRLTMTELAEATGLNKAAVQRLTHTLLNLDYLGRDQYKRYHLTPRVLALGQAFSGGSDLRRTAEPLLERFSRRMDCTVNLSVLEDREVVILIRHEVERFFKFDLQVGSHLPAYCTSMGKLLLAALPEAQLNQKLKSMKLERHTAYTITNQKELRAHLKQVRAEGLAQSDREASLALRSLAAPVLDGEGNVAAAISVSLPADDEQTLERKVRQELIELGRELSSLMGYEGPYPTLRPPLGRRGQAKD